MTARPRQLKLGAVTMGAGGPGQHYLWLDPQLPGDASVDVNWYIEQARLAEAAKFDLIFIVDSQFITADSPPHYLNRLEPITLLSALAVTTRHLGLVATMTTSYNDPFNVARRLASLDLISGGRSGWNVVTSGDAGAAANFSRDEHFDYDTRYARGLEFVRVAQGLWDSYEEDAFPRDRGTRTFLDPARQHALNHGGEHFQVAGPLNVSRSPQGQPVIFQAGDSEQGRDLGATIGEGIFTHAATLEQGQAFYADIKSRAAAKGRDPDHVVVMPGMRVYVGDTDAEAREIERDLQLAAQDFETALAELGRPFAWHDFRQYDLDAPFPQQALKYAERGFRTNAEKIARSPATAISRSGRRSSPSRPPGQPRSRAPRPPSPTRSPAGSTPAPLTASTTTSPTPPSGGASAKRSSRSSRTEASPARSTTPPPSAATWASRSRKPPHRRPPPAIPGETLTPSQRPTIMVDFRPAEPQLPTITARSAPTEGTRGASVR